MRKNYLIFFVMGLLFLVGITFKTVAQPSIGGTPPSFLSPTLTTNFDVREFQKLDMAKVNLEDGQYEKNGSFYRVGRSIPVKLNMDNSGTWSVLTDGSKIWRLKIKSADAQGLVVYYDNFSLPMAGKLFLYNESKTQVIGAFTNDNNPESGTFVTEAVQGDAVTLEYHQPGKTIAKPIISISAIGYLYRDTEILFGAYLNKVGESEACEVNINCSEGANWQDQKKGVAKILLTAGGSQGYCSGTLINNTAQDCKKYFLTADHCGEGATTSELTQWIFYFNYEFPGCTAQPSATSKTMTGCTKKANGGNGGNSGSDFYLVELTTANWPSGFVPYFNGWNRNNTGATSGVSIHHPAGDVKKISTFTATLVSSTMGSVANTHWRVTWAATANGNGVTEGGSSGSPIFDSNKRIVGDLTGGGSYCTATTQPDYYGKFSYSWQSNGTTTATQLKSWLDPTSSNVMVLDGVMYPCSTATNPPVAGFVGSPTTIAPGGSVQFTDQSTNTPTSWSWVITPNTGVTFINSTSATSQNPKVQFANVGQYTIAITATNAYGNNTNTKTNYITVATGGCDTLEYPLTGTLIYSYMNGNNSYGDKAKANYFSSTVATNTIQDVYLQFILAKGTGNATIAVWNNSGTSGLPGTTPIATKVVPISTIMTDVTNQVMTHVQFTSPVTLTGPCYVGVTLPTAAGDTVVLLGDTSSDANHNIAFEMWNTNAWYAYNSGSSWGKNVALAIFPIVCAQSTGQAPVADFSGTPTTLAPGGSVQFTDLSTNTPTSWSWVVTPSTGVTYINSTSATSQNPKVQFANAGQYTVALTATNSTGNNTMTKTNYIIVSSTGSAPVAAFVGNPTTVAVGGIVAFTDQSTNTPTGWAWSFPGGTPTSSTVQNPSITYNTPGTYDVTLTATNSYGSDPEVRSGYITVTSATGAWIVQASGFQAASRGISGISIVDANTAWAWAYDGTGGAASVQDFTRTTNGGTTWTPGVVGTDTSQTVTNISAISGTVAYAGTFSGTAGLGKIYKTTNSGSAWVQQNATGYINAASWLNFVHFFDANNGVSMGDPINGKFEVYTTSDGGTTWTLNTNAGLAASNIYSYTNDFCAVGNTIWFGTNGPKVYKSTDKGLSWTSYTTALTQVTSVSFQDTNIGFAMYQATSSFTAKKSTDGGATWATYTLPANFHKAEICPVPGLTNTMVSVGAATGDYGSSYTLNSGTSFAVIDTGVQYTTVKFYDQATGWAGGFNQDATTEGIYKWVGPPAVSCSANPGAITSGNSSAMTGSAAGGYGNYQYSWTSNPAGFTSTLANPNVSPTITTSYTLTVQSAFNVVASNCQVVVYPVGIDETSLSTVSVYPNPASDQLYVDFGTNRFNNVKVTMYNVIGAEVYSYTLNSTDNIHKIDLTDKSSGIYYILVSTPSGTLKNKITLVK